MTYSGDLGLSRYIPLGPSAGLMQSHLVPRMDYSQL